MLKTSKAQLINTRIKLFWIWIRSGKDNLSRQRSTYFPLMGREFQVILGVKVWQCMSEIQLLGPNVTLRRYIKEGRGDFHAVDQRSLQLYLGGPLTNTQTVGAVPAGQESRSHCVPLPGSEWWRWGAALTSRSKTFCVWTLLLYFGPCASMRTTIQQVSTWLWCGGGGGRASLLFGNGKKRNWNMELLEATKGREKVSIHCHMIVL